MTRSKKIIVGGLLIVAIAFAMAFGCMLGLNLNSQVQVAYATGPENVAASELKIELSRVEGKPYTTFAGGKYLHINPAYGTLETNSSSAGADMEYDESTGVLKLYDTDNMSTYNGDLSLYGLNSSDKQLTIEDYYNGFNFYNLAFEKGNLTLENVSNSETHFSIVWKNKFKINGELTIRGNTRVRPFLAATGYNYDVQNIIEAGTLKLLGNSSLTYRADSSDDIYSIVYVNSLVLNTDGELYLDSNTETDIQKVLYASDVTLTKVKEITLIGPDNYEDKLTNSTYLRNAPTSPISGYYSAIIQEGEYGDYIKIYYLVSDSTYFTVSFNKNGGTGTMAPVSNVNGTFVLPECTFAPPTGYGDLEFQYWADKSSGGNTYAEGDSYTLVENITFYAKWKTATNHNVSFNANGGTGSMAGGSYLGAYTLPACTITAPSGKQFKCWALGSASGTQFNAGDTYYLHKDVTFYPVWEDIPRAFTTQPQGVATKEVGQTHQISWAVNFDAVEYGVYFWNGSAWQEMYRYDSATTPAGTVMNYNITHNAAEEIRYNVDCYYTEFDYITSEEFTITWVNPAPTEYMVSYNDNGGSGSMIGDVVEDGEEFTLEPCEFEAPDGKQFAGWAVGSVDATPLKQAGDKITITADTIIYAIWEDIPHVHTMQAHPANAATCTTAGNSAYWHCTECNKYFSDAEGNTEIELDSTVIPATGHDWGEWETTTPATCTAAGEKTRTCANDANHKEHQEIAALGHEWSEWQVVTPATETTEGLERRVCAHDANHVEERAIPMIGHVHNIQAVAAKAATCEVAGNIAHYECTGCHRLFSDELGANQLNAEDVVIAALGHDWGEWEVLTPAGVGVAGVEQRVCSRDANHKETRPIEALPYPHREEGGVNVYEATATQGQAKDVATLFTQAKAANGKVELTAGTLKLTFNANAVNAIGGGAASLTANVLTSNFGIEGLDGIQTVIEISFTGATFANGSVHIELPFVMAVPSGKVAKVYYVNGANKTDMNATFENGKVSFDTNHFSKFAVVFEDEAQPAPVDPEPQPEPQPEAPKGGLSGGAIAGIVIAVVVVLAGAGVGCFFLLKKKGIIKLGEKHEKAEEPKDDPKDEANE